VSLLMLDRFGSPAWMGVPTPGYSLAMAIAIQVVKVDRQYEWSLGE